MDKNEHAKRYLAYYIDFSEAPRFALMLNGPWGIGKTQMLQSFLKENVSSEKKIAYISLNGIDKINDLDDALFRATYQIMDNKAVRLTGRAAQAALKYLKIEIDVKDLVNKTDADIIVFDDLERCSIPIEVVLGYINQFVEHELRKVIVVANEAEILGDYQRVREKVIGRTFQIQSVFDHAIEAFLASIRDAEARKFLTNKKADIGQIFNQSASQNLRILQQALWDFERFFSALEDRHRANEKAMTSLLALLLSLSFELRAGRLIGDDLVQRHPR